jgi:hypothetical protein
MIIALLTGGLGNQFFQYAMGRRLAVQHGTELLLDTRGYSIDGEERPRGLEAFRRHLSLLQFSIKARPATDEEIAEVRDEFLSFSIRDRLVRIVRKVNQGFLWKESHIVERKYGFERNALSLPNNIYLQGYWQSEKYFLDIEKLIRQELQPIDKSIGERAKRAVESLKNRYGRVVSLHVRRGDLSHAHEVLKKPTITHAEPISGEYIKEALKQFDDDTCFFVFSDTPKDIQWCRENIRARRIEFSNAESELWDFVAMSSCDDNIIANSTFSWWAAWLNQRRGRRVIAPRTWSVPGSKFYMSTEDLIPTSWQML